MKTSKSSLKGEKSPKRQIPNLPSLTPTNLTLREAISISGTLYAFDNSPHAAMVVQAIIPHPLSLSQSFGRGIKGEGVIATTLSDESGKYQFVNLKPGRYQVRYYSGIGDGVGDGYVSEIPHPVKL